MQATSRTVSMSFGAKPEDLKKTNFKSEMKKLFKKQVSQCTWSGYPNRGDVDQAVNEISLHMIAKT